MISVVTGSPKNGTSRTSFTKLRTGEDETGREIHVASSETPSSVSYSKFSSQKVARGLPAEFTTRASEETLN